MTRKVTIDTIEACRIAIGPAQKDEREGHGRAEQHDAGLDVELDAEAGVEPARQADHIGDHEASDERDERRLEVVIVRLIPLADANTTTETR